MSLIRKAFKRLHYPVDVIAQCVRGYLAYALSLRDLEEMMAERGILVDHSTLYDKSEANTAALAALNAEKAKDDAITVRQQKYLNNLVEQDHRNIKRRVRPMLGFKPFRGAQGVLAGIEVVTMIRKGQYQHPEGNGLSPAEPFYLMIA
jgi:putative transposase